LGDEELNVKKTIAVIDAIFALAKRKPEKKNQACTGFEPLTSAIPVQRSNQIAMGCNPGTGSARRHRKIDRVLAEELENLPGPEEL